MKSKIIALVLFVSTIGIVALYPPERGVGAGTGSNGGLSTTNVQTAGRPRIDVVFVLDTTGSMGGMIEAAKEKIWSIASTMAAAQPTPVIRMGLVAYRDRGDAYVTRVFDLSSDLDSMYAELMDFRADGGGDGPESVNQALHDAVHKISWSRDDQAYRVLFLVGDAPPHMDYQDDVKYQDTVAVARDKGITLNTIQCGNDNATRRRWEQIAQLADGRYFRVEQSGSAVAITTPYDERLASLSKALDDTRLYYGNEEDRKRQKRKLAAAEKLHAGASAASRARRATFNASEGGESNFLGEGELVEDVAKGRVDLSDIDRDMLPQPMQSMAPADLEAHVAGKVERRNELRRQIKDLAGERSEFLRKKRDSFEDVEASLDDQIYTTVREQVEAQGMKLEAGMPAY